MDILSSIMLVSAGLFAGGAASFSWSRSSIWRTMPSASFIADFAATLKRTDKVQPPLLLTAIATSAMFAIASEGLARALAVLTVAGFTSIFVGSLAVLVPLQRRLIAHTPIEDAAVAPLRARWLRGQGGRAIVSVIAFATSVIATLA